jgi:4-amino-4-deoxy-L-arabinose transferase-like glycosyltransferase
LHDPHRDPARKTNATSLIDRTWLRWTVVLVAAIGVRGAWLYVRAPALKADADGYRQLAASLVEKGVFGYPQPSGSGGGAVKPTAFRPPLYPLLLAAVGATDPERDIAAAALHLVLGVGTVGVTFWLADRWRLGNWGLVAAALVALDPILLNQSNLLMTETLATCLAVAALAALTCYARYPTFTAAASSGAAIGVAALCRPTFLAWLPWVALLMIACRPPSAARWRFLRAATLVMAAVLALGPWLIRNCRVFGHPIAGTTHGGYTLLLGNNREFYDFLRRSDWGRVWDSQRLDREFNRAKTRRSGNEVAADHWAYRQALECIRREPRMFVYSTLVRVGRLWGLVPHQVKASEDTLQQLARWSVGAWYLSCFALALLGAATLRRRLLVPPWGWGVTLCLAFTTVHAFYWSNMRMRAPLVPVICLLAAAGARRLSRRCAAQNPA